jgi:sorbitol-specific phosphotransferase system component IIA
MYLGESDIIAILADLAAAGGGVQVTLGGNTVTGLLDREAVEILGDQMPGVVAAEQVIHVQDGVLPGLQSGAAITVGGTAYVVLKVLPYGDGAMVRALLRTP